MKTTNGRPLNFFLFIFSLGFIFEASSGETSPYRNMENAESRKDSCGPKDQTKCKEFCKEECAEIDFRPHVEVPGMLRVSYKDCLNTCDSHCTMSDDRLREEAIGTARDISQFVLFFREEHNCETTPEEEEGWIKNIWTWIQNLFKSSRDRRQKNHPFPSGQGASQGSPQGSEARVYQEVPGSGGRQCKMVLHFGGPHGGES